MKIEAQHAATKTRWSQNKNKQKKLSSKIFLIKKETIKKQFFAQLWDSLEWNATVLYIRYHI